MSGKARSHSVTGRRSRLERIATGYLRRVHDHGPVPVGKQRAHILDAAEREDLRRVHRGVVLRAGGAGALSALISATSAVLGAAWFGGWSYWLFFGGITLAATVVEILFLYLDGLWAAHRISVVSGLELFPGQSAEEGITSSMVRAALELPNPLDVDPWVDPLRHASRWQVVLATLVYKAKIMISNIILKVLLRKVLLRGAARAWLEFIAIPVTAAWNAIVSHWIQQELRIRAMGPSAIEESLPQLAPKGSPELQAALHRVVGCCVSTSRDIHPNHIWLLQRLREWTGLEIREDADSPDALLEQVAMLEDAEQEVVLQMFAFCAAIDGRVASSELRLGEALHQVSGRELDPSSLRHFLRSFRGGRELPVRRVGLENETASTASGRA